MSIYPFMRLERDDQRRVSHELQAAYFQQGVQEVAFQSDYRDALLVMAGKKEASTLSVAGEEILNELNNQADPFTSGWKQTLPTVTILTNLLLLGSYGCTAGSAVSAGMSLLYLRSHKIIALASACSGCALLILSSVYKNMVTTFQFHERLIENLSWKNQAQFSEQVNAIYKSSLFFRRLFSQSNETGQSHKGLQLLRDHLSAVEHARNVLICLFNGAVPGEFPGGAQGLDKSFFMRLSKLARSGMISSGVVSVLLLAWTSYAYLQKARLMAITALVQFVGASLITYELIVLSTGSKRVYSASDDEIGREFQAMALHSFLLKRMGLQTANAAQIQNAVVIPFEAVLKLVPSWNVK